MKEEKLFNIGRYEDDVIFRVSREWDKGNIRVLLGKQTNDVPCTGQMFDPRATGSQLCLMLVYMLWLIWLGRINHNMGQTFDDTSG